MKCEWVRQNIVLYVYDELPDDGRFELRRDGKLVTSMEGLPVN